MDSGVIPRSVERAADARRRIRQLTASLTRLRVGASATAEDVRFAQQAAARARGRASGAERDAQRARDLLHAAYNTAARTEAAAADFFRTLRQAKQVEAHSRIADKYQLLAVVVSGSVPDGVEVAEVPDRPPGENAASGTFEGTKRTPSEVWQGRFTVVDLSDLADLRAQIRQLLAADGLDRSAVEDVALAAQEIASNGIRHGTPPVQVNVAHDGGRVVCAVVDQGAGFDWAAATDRQSTGHPLPEGRFGLRLAQELSDELTTVKDDEGFTVRIVKRL